MGACWAFGAAGAFESEFLIATNKTLDLSENNIQNLGLRYSIYGDVSSAEGSSYYTSTSYFVSWLGGINTTADTYDELGKYHH
jgi:C1A family cysteine protease